MKKIITLCIAAVLIIGIAAGCKKEEKQPAKDQQAAQPAPKPEQPATPPPTADQPPAGEEAEAQELGSEEQPELPPVYSYNPIRADGKPKRNPFQPLIVDVRPTTLYEVSQMGVNGVIMHGIKRASVMTPNCQTSFVMIDDPIGIHDGRVVDISLEGVLVRETFVDIHGRIQEYERLIPNRVYARCK